MFIFQRTCVFMRTARIFIVLLCLAPTGLAGTVAQAAGVYGENTYERPSARIVGGKVAEAGQYPWMAALVDNARSTVFDGAFCGGTLINDDWVLTAAHCVYDEGVVVSPGRISVVVGRDDLTSSSGERISVTRIKTHPDYNEATNENDLALVNLSRPSGVAPLHQVGQSFDMPMVGGGVTVRALGWGDTVAGHRTVYPADLHEVDLTTVSQAECQDLIDSLSGFFGGLGVEIVESMLCTAYTGNKDTCKGDSGGPVVVPGPDGGWLQAGITSFGPGCPTPGIWGVYTRVSSYTEWIASETCSVEERPAPPVLNVALTGNTVSVTVSGDSAAEGVRLYFAPYPEGSPVAHVDLGDTSDLSVPLPGGTALYLAAQAYRASCTSGFSNVEYFQVP